jgi:inner membrane transporter RhtA
VTTSPASFGKVLASTVSIQFGAALASSLFDRVGANAVVLMRQGFAAIMLLAISRPSWRNLDADAKKMIGAFGLVFSVMNLTFYASVARLPLGVAVTIELLGPLGLAGLLSRRAREFGFVLLAVVGVVILGWSSHGLSTSGVIFALIAAVGWGTYIHLSSRAGSMFSGFGALALSMGIATILSAPFGLMTGGRRLLDEKILALGLVVAVLSAVLPFTLEMSALRQINRRTFGVLMSVEPALAGLAGFVVLNEHLGWGQLAGIVCVTAACAGTALGTDVSKESEQSSTAEMAI